MVSHIKRIAKDMLEELKRKGWLEQKSWRQDENL